MRRKEEMQRVNLKAAQLKALFNYIAEINEAHQDIKIRANVNNDEPERVSLTIETAEHSLSKDVIIDLESIQITAQGKGDAFIHQGANTFVVGYLVTEDSEEVFDMTRQDAYMIGNTRNGGQRRYIQGREEFKSYLGLDAA